MQLIDGNAIAASLIAELKSQVAALPGRKPCLALVRVGEDPASVSYVKKKEKTAAEIGIESRIILPPVTISQAELEKLIDDLNADPTVDGILVQSPQVFVKKAQPSLISGLRQDLLEQTIDTYNAGVTAIQLLNLLTVQKTRLKLTDDI